MSYFLSLGLNVVFSLLLFKFILSFWIGFFFFGIMILVFGCWVVVVLLCTGTLLSSCLVDS